MMKKKIVVLLIVVVVITGMVIGAIAQPYRIRPADIRFVKIWASESWPQKYYVQVEAGGSNTCWRPWKYVVLRFGNIIFVRVLTLHHRDKGCGMAITYEEKVIELGRRFMPGMEYVIRVNDVTETFTGSRCEEIPQRLLSKLW
jgi:hypothetical protein